MRLQPTMVPVTGMRMNPFDPVVRTLPAPSTVIPTVRCTSDRVAISCNAVSTSVAVMTLPMSVNGMSAAPTWSAPVPKSMLSSSIVSSCTFSPLSAVSAVPTPLAMVPRAGAVIVGEVSVLLVSVSVPASVASVPLKSGNVHVRFPVMPLKSSVPVLAPSL